jgi:hypothetical protein
LSYVAPGALNLLPATFRTLWGPPWFNLYPYHIAHVRRHLPTQRVAGWDLLRAIEHLSDPDEMAKPQVVNPQLPPLMSTQNLLDLEDGP